MKYFLRSACQKKVVLGNGNQLKLLKIFFIIKTAIKCNTRKLVQEFIAINKLIRLPHQSPQKPNAFVNFLCAVTQGLGEMSAPYPILC